VAEVHGPGRCSELAAWSSDRRQKLSYTELVHLATSASINTIGSTRASGSRISAIRRGTLVTLHTTLNQNLISSYVTEEHGTIWMNTDDLP
jgi:hypothetical protein